MNALAIEALKASATAQLYSAIETDYGASELADGDTASGSGASGSGEDESSSEEED